MLVRAARRPAVCYPHSGNHESESKSTTAHCFAGPQRHLDFVRHRGEAQSGRRDQVVRRRRACGQTAEAWRLLAHGVGGSDFAAEANAGDWFRAVQAGDGRETTRATVPFSGHEPADARRYRSGHLLGGIAQKAAAAEVVVKKMRYAFSQIEKKARRREQRVRVYCEAWPNPRISSPPWVAELVSICGGEMVVPPGEKITEAQVAAARPEVIVLAWAATASKADPEQAYKVTAWKDVPAIQNRLVHVISDELLNTPSPSLVKGARELWNALLAQNQSEREKRRK